MKKNHCIYNDRWLLALIFIMVFCISSAFLLLANQEREKKQEQEHKPIIEKVTVTNVEVPVRVLYKGEPVTDLSKDDFTVYENKKKVNINGFFMKRKKIKVTETQPILQKQVSKPPLLRTFVLVFSITDFNDYLEKAVDHLFENTFRDSDRLLIFANDKTREYENLQDRKAVKNQLIIDLREQSQRARRNLLTYINKIETYLNIHDFRIQLHKRDEIPQRLVDFLKKYLLTWNEYKKKYLAPRVDRFYFFSRYLENLETEKWVFNFYQFELFPKIRFSSETMARIRDIASSLIQSPEAGEHSTGKLINTLMNQLLVDLHVNKGFPTEEISKLFYKVDATFHSFFIKSINRADINELEYEEVASEVEDLLKEITRTTGGENITSNNLVKSIETVSQLEDVYYILTYAPSDPKKAGKLKIKVKNNDYKVLYDDNFRADYINDYLQKLEKQIQTPDIKIDGFSFKGKVLAFTVRDYLMREIKGESHPVGKMKVRIRLINKDNNSLFDQQKILTAQKTEFKISLGAFKKIKKGKYNFLIDAVDLLTGKEADLQQQVLVER
jgi:hypothetical protein